MRFLATFCALVLLSVAATGQTRPPGRPYAKGKDGRGKQFKQDQFKQGFDPQVERIRRMSPEQREQVLAKLDPRRRAVLEDRLKKIEALSPEQRAELASRFEAFQHLPVPRRQAMRTELQHLRGMAKPERSARLKSDEAKQIFTPEELALLREVSGDTN